MKELEKYNVFEPSEVKMLALRATVLYFNNMSEETKKKLMEDPIKYTTMFAKIYRDTIEKIRNDAEFLDVRYRR